MSAVLANSASRCGERELLPFPNASKLSMHRHGTFAWLYVSFGSTSFVTTKGTYLVTFSHWNKGV